ncbi:MAG: NADH:ubiquinone reductase (Na(+)-transporting) subunit B [Spirochaetaceae bacterium]|jgi:Na+-transporting NADH:ubiquinone oxidoreductase subunit B|nr:NADH:ubiquinone reductase (Na(+)-transporting) subunit B [Spirochaetaceae bacterium]
MGLRRLLDNMKPLFKEGGKLQKLYPFYDAIDTFLYRPDFTTRTTAHVRDGMDLKRIMIIVFFAVFPTLFAGMWNVGFLANSAFQANPELLAAAKGWRIDLLTRFVGFDPGNLWANLAHGAVYFVPVYIVAFAVGTFWEVLFASVRKHEVSEGFFVTTILFPLILPPTIPLWQVVLGVSFGLVIGKEVFGGTGYNFLNPALTGRAFLFFAYPGQLTGETVWVPVDGLTSATPLAQGGAEINVTWMQAFLGVMPGSLGETSTLAILIGGALLIITGVASLRIIVGVLLGAGAMALAFNIIGSESTALFALPWYWHFVLGGFAFGTIFMATDPVSAAMTNTGKWLFGILIGVMVILIRVINPAFPEGMMLAILFGNLCAPLIDHFVVSANIKRRMARHVQH